MRYRMSTISEYSRGLSFGSNANQEELYFKQEEHDETAMGQQYDKSLPLEHREHTYKTGAVYQGNMRGGFRDGKGTMTWPDKARYEGDWKQGQASGSGKFFHADGGVYTGQFSENKCKGYGIYKNQQGSKYEG